MIKVTDLRCEYLRNPLGIDILKPRLGWKLQSDTRNEKQTQYRIMVATNKKLLEEEKADLWDSGIVKSDKNIHIRYEGKDIGSETKCFWKVRVWDKNGNPSEWSKIAHWRIGLLTDSDWKESRWIGEKKRRRARLLRKWFIHDYDPSPLLRKSFTLKTKPKNALIYITSLGDYELYINGEKIGNRCLSPEWTDYKQRIQYQTYEVESALLEGENAVGVMLGDGWFKGNLGPFGVLHNHYGVTRRFKMLLHIFYEDGTSDYVYSDEHWKIWEDGPIQMSDHFMGEVYDAKKEQRGWDQPDFNASEWKKVWVYDPPKAQIVAQMNEPIEIIEELTPIEVSEPNPGEFVFNIGQNISGFCKIHLNPSLVVEGAKVMLRHGELLNDDGTLYTKNLVVAKNEDIFLLDSNESRPFHPHFTYRGFQYVEVTGLKQGVKPPLDMISACSIGSNCEKTYEFESSHPDLNQLMKNIYWTQRNNMISVPTDCPQRGERMGWMGDTTGYAQTSMFMMDMGAFYSKWIKDIRDAQDELGRYPDFVPYPRNKVYKIMNFYCAPAWADCGVILPWLMYLNYADKEIIQDHYTSAKNFIDHLIKVNPDLIWTESIGHNYADWLNGDIVDLENYPEEGAAVPPDVFSTAFFAYSTRLLAKMAEIIGKDEEANYYTTMAEKIKNQFIKTFLDDNGIIKGDNQAGYALVLFFKLYRDGQKEILEKHLIRTLKEYDYRLSTGFLSTLPFMMSLTDAQHNNLAYDLLLSERVPSWLYMVRQGATTMWERWDGFVEGRGLRRPRMNSFDHFAFGCVGEWIYRVALGINYYEEEPGYKKIMIEPHPIRKIEWMRGTYTSIYGDINVGWNFSEKLLKINIEIPVNTTAQAKLPIHASEIVKEGNKEVENGESIKIIEKTTKNIIMELGSGAYEFQIILQNRQVNK